MLLLRCLGHAPRRRRWLAFRKNCSALRCETCPAVGHPYGRTGFKRTGKRAEHRGRVELASGKTLANQGLRIGSA